MIIEILVILGSILDLTLTYKYLSAYSKRFPKKDYTVIEANPLVRYLIRRSGIGEGMFQSAIAIIPILIILLYLIPINFRWFMAGCYYMMCTFHLTNFLALKRLGKPIDKNCKEVKNGKKERRKNSG